MSLPEEVLIEILACLLVQDKPIFVRDEESSLTSINQMLQTPVVNVNRHLNDLSMQVFYEQNTFDIGSVRDIHFFHAKATTANKVMTHITSHFRRVRIGVWASGGDVIHLLHQIAKLSRLEIHGFTVWCRCNKPRDLTISQHREHFIQSHRQEAFPLDARSFKPFPKHRSEFPEMQIVFTTDICVQSIDESPALRVGIEVKLSRPEHCPTILICR